METSELFRKTLKAYLDKMPRGSQSRLADKLEMERRYLNDFLNGRKPFSESKREYIAQELGYSYIDFLIMGRNMFSEEIKNEIKQKPFETGPLDVDLLRYIIKSVEDGLAENDLELSPGKKAEFITLLYENYSDKQRPVNKEETKETVVRHLRLIAA